MFLKRLLFIIALITPITLIPHPVPASLNDYAVYYQHSRQLPRFSCGFNALYNAANVEKINGVSNPFSNYPAFEKSALAFANVRKLDTLGSLYNHEIDFLARTMHLQPFINVSVRNEQITYLFEGSVSYTYPHNASYRVREMAKKKAFEKHTDGIINRVKQHLASGRGQTRVVHFGCFIKTQGVGHIVLASLVQNGSGRALYLFDNMNEPLYEDSDLKFLIDYLSLTFNVSPRRQFKGMQLPHVWPTIPQPHYGYAY